jgi:hypothetical protein
MSRSSEGQRLQSERKVLDYIYRQKPRQARPKELEEGTGLGSTLYVVLNRFENSKPPILTVERGKRKTVYKWTEKAGELYRKLVPPEINASRLFYERLTKLTNLKAAPDVLVRNLVQGMGATALPVILESVEKREQIDMAPVVGDFKFFIEKYIVYKHNPNLEQLPLKEQVESFSAIHQELKDHPERFSQHFDDLKEAVDSYKDKVLKEDKTIWQLLELSNAISLWILDYFEKNNLSVAKVENSSYLKSYMKRLMALQTETGFPVTIRLQT